MVLRTKELAVFSGRATGPSHSHAYMVPIARLYVSVKNNMLERDEEGSGSSLFLHEFPNF